jgi:hypothetical protein
MQDLVETENDKSIPSFMILQAGFSPDTRTIEVTTYFRAMEVHNFLPINMAEACLTVKQLLLSLSQEIGHFSLTIHAFNAYSDPDFSCLEKISMDYLENMKVMIELAFPDRGLPWMAAQLQEKRDLKESRINPNGISNMIQGMEFYNADLKGKSNMQKYDKDLIKKMKSIYADIEKYNQKRTNRSYSAEAMEIYANIKSTLDEVIKSIKK